MVRLSARDRARIGAHMRQKYMPRENRKRFEYIIASARARCAFYVSLKTDDPKRPDRRARTARVPQLFAHSRTFRIECIAFARALVPECALC